MHKDESDNHYYEKFEDGTVNDITEEIPFEIPCSWEWSRFNNVVNYKMGKTPPRNEKLYWGNDYNWVSIADMKDSEVITDTKEGISQKGFKDKFSSTFSPKGTLIMSFKLTVGKVSILGMDALHNEAIISIFPFYDKNNVFRDYLFKILTLISTFGETKDAIKGRTLNSESINKLFVPLPPINEQKRIVEKIELLLPYITKYASVNITLEDLNNSYKEDLKKSILQYAIQGKLVSQNSDDESAELLINRILDEKRKLIKTKQIKKENLSVIYKGDTDNQFYEKFDNGTIINITDEIPFDIPSSWAWVRMKNICIINPRNNLDDDIETSFIPMSLIDSGYANSHTSEIKKWKEIKSGFTHFKENDIGLAKITPCFQNRKSTIFKNLKNGFGAGTTELHILRPINKLISTEYILWLIKTPYFIDNGVKTYSGTAGQQRINKDFLPNFLVPIPNYEMQIRIINKLKNFLNSI